MNLKGLVELEFKELFEVDGGETNSNESTYRAIVNIIHEIKERFT